MQIKRRREGLILFVLATIQFCHVSDFVLLMPLGPQLMRVMNLSPVQFSLLVSSYTWSAGISGFFASLFVDRFDRKRVLLACYLGFMGGTALCGLVHEYTWLLFARIVAGAFGGTLAAGVFAIVADVVPVERRGAATGIILSAFSVASVVGIPIGLFLASHYTWSVPFLAIAFLGIGVWALAAWQLPPMRGHLAAQEGAALGADLRYVITHGPHIRAYLLTTFVIGGGFLVIPFLSPFLVSNVGLTEAQLPYVYLIGGGCTFFSARLFGGLTDRYGAHKVFTGVALCSLVPLVLLPYLPRVPFAWALVLTSLFFIFVSGRWVPAMTLITSASEARVRGSFLSFNSSLQQIALGLATYVSGHIVGQAADGSLTHFPIAGWLGGGVTLCSIWLAHRVKNIKVDEVTITYHR